MSRFSKVVVAVFTLVVGVENTVVGTNQNVVGVYWLWQSACESESCEVTFSHFILGLNFNVMKFTYRVVTSPLNQTSVIANSEELQVAWVDVRVYFNLVDSWLNVHAADNKTLVDIPQADNGVVFNSAADQVFFVMCESHGLDSLRVERNGTEFLLQLDVVNEDFGGVTLTWTSFSESH